MQDSILYSQDSLIQTIIQPLIENGDTLVVKYIEPISTSSSDNTLLFVLLGPAIGAITTILAIIINQRFITINEMMRDLFTILSEITRSTVNLAYFNRKNFSLNLKNYFASRAAELSGNESKRNKYINDENLYYRDGMQLSEQFYHELAELNALVKRFEYYFGYNRRVYDLMGRLDAAKGFLDMKSVFKNAKSIEQLDEIINEQERKYNDNYNVSFSKSVIDVSNEIRECINSTDDIYGIKLYFSFMKQCKNISKLRNAAYEEHIKSKSSEA